MFLYFRRNVFVLFAIFLACMKSVLFRVDNLISFVLLVEQIQIVIIIQFIYVGM